MLGSAESEMVRLISRESIFAEFQPEMEMGQWVMGQLCDGSHGSWVTKDDPFPSLIPTYMITIPQRHRQTDRLTDGRTDNLPWQNRATRSFAR